MRVLVTGGSGFIGAVFVESLLADGVTVLNLDAARPAFLHHIAAWSKCDILDAAEVGKAFAQFQPTHLVHLAARTDLAEQKSLAGYAANIEGTENILRAVRQFGGVKRAIVASSMLVCRPGYCPRHDLDYAPDTLYGQSKVRTEELARAAALDCSWCLVRPTTIWGPGLGRLREGLFRTLRKGWYLRPAGPPVWRSYGFVGNTVDQLRAILDAPERQVSQRVFYLGDSPLDLHGWVDGLSQRLCGRKVRRAPRWLLRAVARAGDWSQALGGPAPLNSYRLRNMTEDNVLDVEPTLKLAGPPRYSLDEAMEITCRWIEGQENLNWLKPTGRAAAAA